MLYEMERLDIDEVLDRAVEKTEERRIEGPPEMWPWK
jgi:hypothetical protein